MDSFRRLVSNVVQQQKQPIRHSPAAPINRFRPPPTVRGLSSASLGATSSRGTQLTLTQRNALKIPPGCFESISHADIPDSSRYDAFAVEGYVFISEKGLKQVFDPTTRELTGRFYFQDGHPPPPCACSYPLQPLTRPTWRRRSAFSSSTKQCPTSARKSPSWRCPSILSTPPPWRSPLAGRTAAFRRRTD